MTRYSRQGEEETLLLQKGYDFRRIRREGRQRSQKSCDNQ